MGQQMNDSEIHDYGINCVAEYLSCNPKVVFDLYYELEIDASSDSETISRLKSDAVKYEIALFLLKDRLKYPATKRLQRQPSCARR